MNSAKTVEKEQMEMGLWLKIFTTTPNCTYYFGPFESVKEADLAQAGYIEDLVKEGAQGIAAQIKWCKPRNLTIFFEDELAESC